MEVAIAYFSRTGNTRLACERLARIVGAASCAPLSAETRIAGLTLFATPVEYLDAPRGAKSALEGIAAGGGRMAAILVSYGMMPGRAALTLSRLLKKKGYRVVDYAELRMPESFPPFIAKGWTDTAAPAAKELALFDGFAERLAARARGEELLPRVPRLTGWALLAPPPTDRKRARDMGTLSVDAPSCSGCGACARACATGSLAMASGADPLTAKPVYAGSACERCYACVNACANNALRTAKMPLPARYPGPDAELATRFQGIGAQGT